MDTVKNGECEKEMMFALDKDGLAFQVFDMQIYFNSEHKMKAFDSWMKAKGAAEFEAWFKGMEKLRGTICEKCNWKDPTQIQCFDGHIQGIEPCGGYEEDTP